MIVYLVLATLLATAVLIELHFRREDAERRRQRRRDREIIRRRVVREMRRR